MIIFEIPYYSMRLRTTARHSGGIPADSGGGTAIALRDSGMNHFSHPRHAMTQD